MNNNGGGTGNEIWNGGRRHLKHRSNALHNTRRKITASPSLRRRLRRLSETSETLWGQFEDKAVMTGFKERERDGALSGQFRDGMRYPSPISPSCQIREQPRLWRRQIGSCNEGTDNRRANKRNYHLIDSVCRPSLTR